MNADTHRRSVVVWDVPTAIEHGKPFDIHVGVKCSRDCEPHGWTVEVLDHEGNAVATATVGHEPWAGTAALYYARVRLEASDTAGLHAWAAATPATAGDDEQVAGHDEARASFNVRIVPPPECRLTIVALDKVSRSPVKGAKVVIHPYRAFTDEAGVAELRVPKGDYRLFVSGRGYFPFRRDSDVTADATISAELESDVGPSDAEIWS